MKCKTIDDVMYANHDDCANCKENKGCEWSAVIDHPKEVGFFVIVGLVVVVIAYGVCSVIF